MAKGLLEDAKDLFKEVLKDEEKRPILLHRFGILLYMLLVTITVYQIVTFYIH